MLLCEPNTNANPTRPTKNTQNLYFRKKNYTKARKCILISDTEKKYRV